MQEGSFNWDSLTCYPLSRIERGADLAAAVDECFSWLRGLSSGQVKLHGLDLH
jgi:hypothetical protein